MNSIFIFITCLFIFLNSTNVFCQKKYEFLFQNPALSTEIRVNDLISRMTLKEKATQLFNQTESIDRLGIPAYNWWSESLHGIARAGRATVFPQAMGLSASFDEELMFQIGNAISDEARAKYHFFVKENVHTIYTGITLWAPNINILRDPRWGRGQETYGEDPFLTSRMAVNYIKGLQGNDVKYFKTIATAKHYALHSGPEFTRHTDNNFVNDRDLYETYLPAFKAAVKEGNVQSVMCAFNRFRDKPCCASDLLLGKILRNDFGFKGYVVSDCGGITDFYKKEFHHVVETPSQAWGLSLSAGNDVNCEDNKIFLNDHLDSAISIGIINEKDINTSLTRLFNARFRLGMFDPDDMVPYSKIPMSVIGSEAHLKLAQKAAEKSFVLLKNNGILPLKNVKKLALIGPNADNAHILIANYAGLPINPITPLQALRKKLGSENVLYTPGCPIVKNIYTNYEVISFKNFFHLENGKLQQGLKGSYYNNPDLKGEPKMIRIDSAINFHWTKSPISNLVEEEFSVRWSGILIPQKSGIYTFSGNFKFDGNGNVTLKINDKHIDLMGITLKKGNQYKLDAELIVKPNAWANIVEPSAMLSWVETTSRDYQREALEATRNADVVVFCGGISAHLEGEDLPVETEGFGHGDRTHLDLPVVQEDLLKELQKTGKPIVYINFSGSAISMNWEAQNLPAIVQAFYPGEATGTALTRLLFGDINPSGRLPITFYKSVNDLPDFQNYVMEGRTYRYFKGEPLFTFGYGLSYTTFNYKNISAPSSIGTNSEAKVVVEVTNTGKRDGDEIVQLYISNQEASVPVPIRTLAGFKSIFLKTGETKKIEFTLTPKNFSVIDKNYKRVVEPSKFLISVGGKQPDAKALASLSVIQTSVQVIGSPFMIKE